MSLLVTFLVNQIHEALQIWVAICDIRVHLLQNLNCSLFFFFIKTPLKNFCNRKEYKPLLVLGYIYVYHCSLQFVSQKQVGIWRNQFSLDFSFSHLFHLDKVQLHLLISIFSNKLLGLLDDKTTRFENMKQIYACKKPEHCKIWVK